MKYNTHSIETMSCIHRENVFIFVDDVKCLQSIPVGYVIKSIYQIVHPVTSLKYCQKKTHEDWYFSYLEMVSLTFTIYKWTAKHEASAHTQCVLGIIPKLSALLQFPFVCLPVCFAKYTKMPHNLSNKQNTKKKKLMIAHSTWQCRAFIVRSVFMFADDVKYLQSNTVGYGHHCISVKLLTQITSTLCLFHVKTIFLFKLH